jgi:nucleotide-binding universal stress UspA family protein
MVMAENSPSIVVGIDGSNGSLQALRWAMREAVSRDAAVEVVHCWPTTLSERVLSTPHEVGRASVCMLTNEVAAALEEFPVKPSVTMQSVNGRAGVVLVERAKNADLLVLGAHGHTAMEDVLFGTVVAECVKSASCPVFVVDAEGRAVKHVGRHVDLRVG